MIKSTKTRYSDNFYFYENDEVIGMSLDLYGEYTQYEVDFLIQILNNECVIWDIGANIGYHTCAFASVSKYVYAFEPNHKNFNLLLKNTSSIKNVIAINVAVGDKNCLVSLSDFDPLVAGNYGNLRVNHEGQVNLCIRLDDFIIDKPDFIKIDVEGLEYPVLQGCLKILEQHRPVLYFEAHETPDLPKIYTLLDNLQYHMYWIPIPNFNHKNFKENTVNEIGNSYLVGICASPCRVDSLETNRVISITDTYQDFFARIKEKEHA